MLSIAARPAVSGDTVTLVIPAFEGPREGPVALGLNVATVLNLQIANTLEKERKAADGRLLNFGDGVVQWWPTPLDNANPAMVDQAVRHPNVLAQLALWGKVKEYGRGVIAQTYLSVPEYKGVLGDFRESHPEVWRLTLTRDGATALFETDIPSRLYIFEPIIMEKSVIERFAKPAGIPIFKYERGGNEIGAVGRSFTFLEQGEGVAKVHSGDATGWIRFSELGRYRTEVIDFSAALIRVFRGDWIGAERYFRQTLEYTYLPTDIRIDANILLGLAAAKQGRPGSERFDRAFRLNPYAARSHRYRIMDAVFALDAALKRKIPAPDLGLLAQEVRRRTSEARPYFLMDDPWPAHIDQGLRKLEL